MPMFSAKSQARLMTCHPDLQRLFREVVKSVDCSVLCGHRTREEQEDAFALGHSRAHFPHSKHNVLPSMAADVVPYPVHWDDPGEFRAFAAVVKEQAARLGIKIVWGGDFTSLVDMPHYELT